MEFEVYYLPVYTLPFVVLYVFSVVYQIYQSETVPPKHKVSLITVLLSSGLHMLIYFFGCITGNSILNAMPRFSGSLVFFMISFIDCNMLGVFSTLSELVRKKWVESVRWISCLLMIGNLVATTVMITEDHSLNFDGQVSIASNIANWLFSPYVVLVCTFHGVTGTLLLKIVSKSVTTAKRAVVDSIGIAKNQLYFCFGLFIITIPIYAASEAIVSYSNLWKGVLLSISFNMMGLSIIAMVRLFEAVSMVVRNSRKQNIARKSAIALTEIQDQQNILQGESIIPLTITKPIFELTSRIGFDEPRELQKCKVQDR